MPFPDIELPCKVQAVYSWGGEQDDDLGFIEGDLIEVDNFGDGNWWHGKSKRNKMTGNFPSNFVKILEPVEPKTSSPSAAAAAATSTPSPAPVVSSAASSPAKMVNHSKSNSNSSFNKRIPYDAAHSTANTTLDNDSILFPTSKQPQISHSASSHTLNANPSVSSHHNSHSQNSSFSLSPEEIESQIQQLRQLQQLQQLQNEMQKSQIAHSLSTPQNLNLLVNQLNDFFNANKGKVPSADYARGALSLNHAASNSSFSGLRTSLSNNSIAQAHGTVPAAADGANVKSNLPHSISMPLGGFERLRPFNDAREFSNTSTLKPSNATDVLDHNDSNSLKSTKSNELPPPPPPPAHRVPIKSSYSVNPMRQHNSSLSQNDINPDFLHAFSKNMSMDGNHLNMHQQSEVPGNKPFYQNLPNSNNTSFVAPYDPETLNQSKSSINDVGNYANSATVDDISSISGGTHFNSNESVSSSISTAITDFSATSAGSYYRHKAIGGPIPVPASITNPPSAGLAAAATGATGAGASSNTGLPPIPGRSNAVKQEDQEDSELKASFMKSKYYRRVSAEDSFELNNSKGMVSKLNNAGNANDSQKVIVATTSNSNNTHNPLDVIFVEEKKNKKQSTTNFLKKLFLKEGNTKTNPLNNPSAALPTLKNNNFADLSFDSADTEASWIENKVDLNRSTSISAKDYKLRQKRALENEKYLILEPQKLLTEANSNEVLPISKYGMPLSQQEMIDFNKDFKNIDDFVRNLKHLPYISPKTFVTNEIAIKYANDLDRIRACYIFCTEKIHLIESNEIIDVRNSPAKYINSIFQSKSATVYQLAWLMKVFLDSLKLKNELIVGYFKKPNECNSNLTTNHVWNSVLINNEWRFIDCGLANIHSFLNPILTNNVDSNSSGSSSSSAAYNSGASMAASIATPNTSKSKYGNAATNNSIYFLTKPLELIHTHIPTLIEQQHISPPLDSMIALALPSCYPQFFKTDLNIKKFNNALTRLQDLEVFEIVLEVPRDIEVFCSIKSDEATAVATTSASNNILPSTQSSLTSLKKNLQTPVSSSPTMFKEDKFRDLSLSQIFWKNNIKYCRIKSVLPPGATQGILEIYSGEKGLQKSLTNIHPLSLTVPLFHQGDYRELQFVTRYPTIHCQSHDLYVKGPQIKNLNVDGTYIFSVAQHPSMGITNASGFLKTKLALQTPTGRIIKLRKKDLQTPYGTWEASVVCDEVGVWKGLVVTDGGVAWCVFAEWICK